MNVFEEIDQKRKILEEKIKNRLIQKGKDIEEHAELVKEFLSVIPKEHVDSLITKMEELEGTPIAEEYAIDISDIQTPQEEDEIIQIRNALQQGDMTQAITLAKALHVEI